MKKYIFVLLLILLASISFILVKISTKTIIDINITELNINTTYKIQDIVGKIKNGILINGEEEVLFDKLGSNEISIYYKDYDGIKKEYKTVINVIDKESPIINAKEIITIKKGEKVNLLKNVIVTDNSKEKIKPIIDGNYNINKSGTYNLKYVAKDSSGNESTFEFKLIVKENKKTSVITLNNYYIKVNKTRNVVMVYKLDNNNEYNNLVKTFICSTGDNTPVGIFEVDVKAETLALEGGVYGHYTTRFLKKRGMWFHSVPYFSKPENGHWNSLEYEEYNKLGSKASRGCIRLTTKDAKWIYDNISKGTKVEIYESENLPEGVIKPESIKIDINSENRGWDPTDPDKLNPWKS